MRTKRSNQKKKLNDEKKNDSVDTHRVEEQPSQSMMKIQKSSKLMSSPTTNPVNEEKKEKQLPDTILDLSIKETFNGLPTGKVAIDLPAGEAAVDLPTGEVVVDLPTGEVVVGLPTGEVAVDLPVGEAAVDLPTEEVVVGLSTEEVAVDLPAGEVVVGLSTEEVAVDLPAGEAAVDLPTEEVVVGLPTGEVAVDLTTSNSVTINNENINLKTVAQNSHGKKRSFEESLDLIENKKPDGSIKDEFYIEHMNLKKKCIEMEEQIKVFQRQYIPRPQDANVARYLVDLGNKLSGVDRNQSAADTFTMELLNTIGINQNDLAKFNNKTPTSLARQLIKMKYPNPNPDRGFLQADKTIVEGIIKYVQYCYPNATASTTDIRRAMNNYFSSFTYKKNHSNGY